MVLNDRKAGNWGLEEFQPIIVMQEDGSAVRAFNQGHSVQILIQCELAFFQVDRAINFKASFIYGANPIKIFTPKDKFTSVS